MYDSIENVIPFLTIHVSVFNCGFLIEQIRFGKAIYLLPVLITRNRLILMNKWFAGCGNVKFFGLHKKSSATSRVFTFHGVHHIPRSHGVHHTLPIISRSPEWLDAHYFSYKSMPSYSYAPTSNLSVRMHILIILQPERPQSNHKVPKRRRLVPSWDVVDDRPPHQLVHGETVQEMVWPARRIGVVKSPQFVICEKKVFLIL